MQKDDLGQRSKVSHAFEDHWRTLCHSGAMPHFEAFDPLVIPQLVPRLIILKMHNPPSHEMKVTFSGSMIHEHSGFEMAGHDVREFYTADNSDLLWDSAVAMIESPCGLIQYNDVQFQNAENAMTELTLFPFLGRAAEEFYLAGVMHWVGYTLEQSKQDPILVQPSTRYSWIDIGYPLPDL